MEPPHMTLEELLMMGISFGTLILLALAVWVEFLRYSAKARADDQALSRRMTDEGRG